MIVGGTVVIMRAFEPAALLELIETQRITHVFGLPMMYRALLDHPDVGRRDLSSLRRAMYAMAPMPDADLRQAMEVLDCEFCLGFGQTEMAPLTTEFQPEHQFTHTGSVGTPVANVQVGVMDDQGKLLPWGECGEIVYRGPHAMEGYLRNPEATSEPSPTAGSTLVTLGASTPTASCGSRTGKGTSSRPAARASPSSRSSGPCTPPTPASRRSWS